MSDEPVRRGPGGGAARTGLTELEIACGFVFGFDDALPGLDRNHPELPRQALESVVGEALRRPPCVVSFSGGRDSAAVLALATAVARRDGLPLPVPVTLRFPRDRLADETDWQDQIVRHLGLTEWHRPDFSDELDLIGPYARRVLDRHGLVWPFNAYFHAPIFERAAGGSVLTGIGGDEVFSPGIWHHLNLALSRRRKPRWLDPVRTLLAASPWAVRRHYVSFRAGRHGADKPWLTDVAADVDRVQRVAMGRRESLSFARTVEDGYWRRRGRILGAATLDRLAADDGVRCISPFSSPAVLSAVVRAQGWREYESRSAAMRELVGDLLPDAVLTRSTKASFGTSLFSTHSARFAQTWRGDGLNEHLVRTGVLQRMWQRTAPAPDARTFALFQSAWLSSR